MDPFSESELRGALRDLARMLEAGGQQARLYLAGGAAMVLGHSSDKLTRDIDAAITEGYGPVMKAAEEIARSRGWPRTWLNEQATAYMPSPERRRGEVVFDHPALKVVAASREHMLAMKARAARRADAEDARQLLRLVGCSDVEEVEALVESVFPGEPLGERQRKWLAELLRETARPTADGPPRDGGPGR